MYKTLDHSNLNCQYFWFAQQPKAAASCRSLETPLHAKNDFLQLTVPATPTKQYEEQVKSTVSRFAHRIQYGNGKWRTGISLNWLSSKSSFEPPYIDFFQVSERTAWHFKTNVHSRFVLVVKLPTAIAIQRWTQFKMLVKLFHRPARNKSTSDVFTYITPSSILSVMYPWCFVLNTQANGYPIGSNTFKQTWQVVSLSTTTPYYCATPNRKTRPSHWVSYHRSVQCAFKDAKKEKPVLLLRQMKVKFQTNVCPLHSFLALVYLDVLSYFWNLWPAYTPCRGACRVAIWCRGDMEPESCQGLWF